MYITKSNTFDIIVIGTMSAGKSTLINALIGKLLLPAANEATTATIIRIHDKDGMRTFKGGGYWMDLDSRSIKSQTKINSKVTPEKIAEWNRNPLINFIDLKGDIKGVLNSQCELAIYDTPGPNNSQDTQHNALTLHLINSNNYASILYLLNAQYPGTTDDRDLLQQIQTRLKDSPNKSITFVLNKCDELDPEKGEKIESAVTNAKKYLEKIGFIQPHIIPLSAKPVLLARKHLSRQPLSRSEKISLYRYSTSGGFPSHRDLKFMVKHSGFIVLEDHLQKLLNYLSLI